MYKISLILLLTSPLVFNVPASRAETFSPQTMRTVSSFWSNSNLRNDLDKLCASHGEQNVKSVDFKNCKMECWANFGTSVASRTYPLPYGTPCGLNNKKCEYDGCWGPRGTR
uniref:Putative ixostatin n=1 Tax=Ixodes ricinus TaxID=34613 RepID=A0A0K8RCE9_IXORI